MQLYSLSVIPTTLLVYADLFGNLDQLIVLAYFNSASNVIVFSYAFSTVWVGSCLVGHLLLILQGNFIPNHHCVGWR